MTEKEIVALMDAIDIILQGSPNICRKKLMTPEKISCIIGIILFGHQANYLYIKIMISK